MLIKSKELSNETRTVLAGAIAINDQEEINEANKRIEEEHLKFKSFDEWASEYGDKFVREIYELAKDNGSYIGDSIQVSIELKYNPEDK